jgi:hypothetical protein
MSHYSDNPNSVRVDFFKPSGKWYTTEAVKWTGMWRGEDQLIHDAFKQSLRDHFLDDGKPTNRLNGMTAVCLDPYHELSHPLMINNWKD